MQLRPADKTFVRLLAFAVASIVVLLPFHAFLTVWASQAVGHYTLLRLWKEVVLVVLMGSVGYLLLRYPWLRRRFLAPVFLWPLTLFILVQVLWGGAAYIMHGVTLKAFGYGLISNTRYMLFFMVAWTVAAVAPQLRQRWCKLAFWPLAVVVLAGLLQYFVLPYDVMRHFGYSSATIFPYEDINSNLHYLRIMSTLRGANPLGVYMAVLLSLLLAVRKFRAWWWYGLLAAGTAVLILTFSRGAWVGFVCGVCVVVAAHVPFSKWRWRLAVSTGVVILVAIGAVRFLHHNTTFQNIFLHTQTDSMVVTTSNQGHASALQQGLHDVAARPEGRGTGTAGPASVYNTGHAARIAENYFIQIAQETGWIGLALFFAVNVIVFGRLWGGRQDALSLGLGAGLIAASVASLFSHVWSDDTLAYVWWGLAGIALAPAILQTKAEQTYATAADETAKN